MTTAEQVRTTRGMALWKSRTHAAMKYATYPGGREGVRAVIVKLIRPSGAQMFHTTCSKYAQHNVFEGF